MKYYVYRTEIDTMSGYRNSSYHKAIVAMKSKESVVAAFGKFHDADLYPIAKFEAESDHEAIEAFHDGYATKDIKGCASAHAIIEYALFNGDKVDAMYKAIDAYEECEDVEQLAFSTTTKFDDDEEDD